MASLSFGAASTVFESKVPIAKPTSRKWVSKKAMATSGASAPAPAPAEPSAETGECHHGIVMSAEEIFLGTEGAAPLPTLNLGDFGRSLDTNDPNYRKNFLASRAAVPHTAAVSQFEVYDGTFCFGSATSLVRIGDTASDERRRRRIGGRFLWRFHCWGPTAVRCVGDPRASASLSDHCQWRRHHQ